MICPACDGDEECGAACICDYTTLFWRSINAPARPLTREMLESAFERAREGMI